MSKKNSLGTLVVAVGGLVTSVVTGAVGLTGEIISTLSEAAGDIAKQRNDSESNSKDNSGSGDWTSQKK